MGWSDFVKEQFIGKGSYGKVYRVKRRSDGKTYALKEVNIKFMSHREREDAVNEIRLLASVNHHNIIAYFESFLENDKLCIVTEYCGNGDLFELLRRYRTRRRRLSEDRIWSYFLQICYALRVLHQNKVLHRDIKSPNVFLGENGTIKLGDLGVAKLLKSAMAHTQIGTPYYLSPEIWKSRPYNDKSDVWSLGCLLYEMTTLRHPFDATSQRALAAKIIKGRYAPISREYSSDLADTISACLQVNPNMRPTIDELLELPAVRARMDLVADEVISDATRCAVMNTIKVPRRVQNLSDLTEALPKPMYMQSSPAKMVRDAAPSHPPPEPSAASSAGAAAAQPNIVVNPVIRSRLHAHADQPPLPALAAARAQRRAASEPADNKLADRAPAQKYYVNKSNHPGAKYARRAKEPSPPLGENPSVNKARVQQYYAAKENRANRRPGPFSYASERHAPAAAYPVLARHAANDVAQRRYFAAHNKANNNIGNVPRVQYRHPNQPRAAHAAPAVVNDYRRRYYR
ncbi:NEK protein kinase [Thecamonas trahens ATCC 50062]|uniref:non-specific serine/threonine protein kinase n=1 Tax=Thecamonas trahens ATCC 50062 TaxID=461836 RepID=A0A0L0DC27_THETB|nr:NEK protein kinase [Thecamonas trahens ATCC 50062]KNC49897.1 NEK protein kinase [Thecamonas trahens ATCC 50062]|eukprot:XP_013757378.1 NEK protein kinase [Thecamonas trahens ATCC 50062]